MKKCLLVVDAQKAMFLEEEPIYNENEVIENINKIIKKFRDNEYDICFILHESKKEIMYSRDSKTFELSDSIDYKDEPKIVKTTCSSFYNTDLAKYLEENDIKEIFVTGFQTDYCIDTTVRHGFLSGYNVNLVSDAHSTRNQSYLTADKIILHHNNVLRSFSNVIATESVLSDV